jgi:hypothetical protein
MKHYELVFMDLDETLMDFKAAEQAALARSFGSSGWSCHLKRWLYEARNSALWKALERGEIDQERLKVERFRQVFQELGWAVDPAVFSAVYIEFLSQGIYPPAPGRGDLRLSGSTLPPGHSDQWHCGGAVSTHPELGHCAVHRGHHRFRGGGLWQAGSGHL